MTGPLTATLGDNERIKAAVAQIKANILAAQPDADETVCGGVLDAYGSVLFTPSRDPSHDFSSWGDWEAWEHQIPHGAALKPNGDWIAWHATSGQQFGYPPPNARKKAEMAAVFFNQGKKTRVVPANGGFQVSAVDYEAVRAKVEEQLPE